MLLFALVGIASILINQQFNIKAIFGLRLIFRFYIFYIAIINLDLSETDIKRINSFLVIVFLIQIPVATIKLFIYGQGERAIGTYAVHGGTLSTIIPLIAIGYLIGLYSYVGRKKLYIFLIFGFIYFALIGEKRAFAFFLPVFMGFSIMLLWRDKFFEKYKISFDRTKLLVYSSILLVIVAFFALKYIKTLNPEGKVGGSFSIRHAVEYIKYYTTRESKEKTAHAAGRYAVTKLVFSSLKDQGFDRFIFGYGPGAQIKSRFAQKGQWGGVAQDLKISYGVTPMTFIMMEYGFLGVIIYLIFMVYLFINCLNYWAVERDRYWKAFSFGSLCFSFSMILLWPSYGVASLVGDVIPLVFYYCMAITFYNLNNRRQPISNSLDPV